jgi:hypothetical protein
MHAHVTISVPKAFRVVFSAELDESRSSDIAIDDVAFSEVYFDSLIKTIAFSLQPIYC